MSGYVVAPHPAAPNGFSFPMGRVIADDECHALSSWVDSTCIAGQPASGLSTQVDCHSIEERREASSCEGEAET